MIIITLSPGDARLRPPRSCQARFTPAGGKFCPFRLHFEQASRWRRSVDVRQHQVEAATHPVAAAVTRLLQAEPDQAGQQGHDRRQEEAEQPGGGAPAAGGPTRRTRTRRRKLWNPRSLCCGRFDFSHLCSDGGRCSVSLQDEVPSSA